MSDDNNDEGFEEVFDPNNVPTEFSYRDSHEELTQLRNDVHRVCAALDSGDMAEGLVEVLNHSLSPYQEVSFDEAFNIRDELITQMKMVKAVRKELLDPNGSIKKGTTTSEVKSILDASMRLANQLNVVNKDLINQERMQAVESAFMDVLNTFPQALQLEYVGHLEKRMKALKELQKK